mmetsp:Transcript_62519/g.148897  ORF Transcript_62519/g.148897 Transcript_62519/m.148897 type:complete len:210 (-) Transcript_62519:206-835(-)
MSDSDGLVVVVWVKYEKISLDVPLDLMGSASHFMLEVFLRTNVVPMRQKLVGFKGDTGRPLEFLWSTDLRAVGARTGLKLMLIQMPPGQELDEKAAPGEDALSAAGRAVERTAQRVAALDEAVRREGKSEARPAAAAWGGDAERMMRAGKLRLELHESAMKVMLSLDAIEVGGDEERAARRALVSRTNTLMDRLEALRGGVDDAGGSAL